MPAVTNIPGLPAATSVDGDEELWAVQNGRDVRLTADQIAALGGGGGGNIPADLTPVNGVVIANGTSPVGVTAPGTVGQVLTSNGAGLPPSMQTAPTGTVPGGGTGLSNLIPVGGLLVANGVSPINITSPGTAGQVLTSNGAGVPPSMQNASASSGTVPQGGTGVSTLTAHGVLIGEGTSPVTVTTPGTAGQVLTSNGPSADPSMQSVPIPNIDVAHGGTGRATLAIHGVVVGEGASPVAVVAPSAIGQVLTSNGSSVDPVWAMPGAGTAPDFATWLQAKVTAAVASGTSQSADWIWGDVSLAAAVTINITGHLNGFRFDGHGATFTAGFTDTTKDLIKFIVPDANIASVNGLSIANMTINGTGAALPRKVKNNLVLSCKLSQSAIFGFEIHRVVVIGANETGILLYGNVFEGDLISCLARDNDRAGAEFRNPTVVGGSGIISSLKVIGGDYRTNKYGILTSAETTFQEPGGIHVTDCDFIANTSAGIYCPAGAASITGCHFENNCSSNGGETAGAIWNVFGPIKIDACDATSSNSSPQIYLVDFLGQASQPCFISRSYSQNTDLGVFRQTASLAGNGTLYIDESMLISRFTLVGGAAWDIINTAAARKTRTVTAATDTILDTDTDVIFNRAGTVTETLPDPAKYANRALWFKTIQAQAVVSATANVIPLVGGAAGTSIISATNGEWTKLVSNAAAWVIMASAVPGGGGAPLNSPAFTGNPTAPTPAPGDNDTTIPTTAFVTAAIAAATFTGGTPTGYLNALNFGCTGNPAGDDTVAMNALGAAARATASSWGTAGIYFPPYNPATGLPCVYVATGQVDFSGIASVWCDGWLAAFGVIAGPVYTFGQTSVTGATIVKVRGFYYINVAYDAVRNPMVRLQGFNGGKFETTYCNSWIEVFADAGGNNSTAYSEFHLGKTFRLELRSGQTPANASSGWINSNQFYGGAITQLRIGGPWKTPISLTNNGSGLIRANYTAHGYTTGEMIELYKSVGGHSSIFGLVTVIDANNFDIQGSTYAGPYTASDYMIMGPSGYPHNNNQFNNPDIEDTGAVVHIQGLFNRLENARTEATGTIAFGPQTYGNSYEQGNSDAGFLPAVNSNTQMTVQDFSGGKNWTGWVPMAKGFQTEAAVSLGPIATGAVNAMVVTPVPALYTLTAGKTYVFQANLANTTTTPTVNISGTGAKTIVKRVNTALAAGDYLASMWLTCLYDGTNMVLLNPVVN